MEENINGDNIKVVIIIGSPSVVNDYDMFAQAYLINYIFKELYHVFQDNIKIYAPKGTLDDKRNVEILKKPITCQIVDDVFSFKPDPSFVKLIRDFEFKKECFHCDQYLYIFMLNHGTHKSFGTASDFFKDEDLIEYISQNVFKKCFLFIDSCYSGNFCEPLRDGISFSKEMSMLNPEIVPIVYKLFTSAGIGFNYEHLVDFIELIKATEFEIENVDLLKKFIQYFINKPKCTCPSISLIKKELEKLKESEQFSKKEIDVFLEIITKSNIQFGSCFSSTLNILKSFEEEEYIKHILINPSFLKKLENLKDEISVNKAIFYANDLINQFENAHFKGTLYPIFVAASSYDSSSYCYSKVAVARKGNEIKYRTSGSFFTSAVIYALLLKSLKDEYLKQRILEEYKSQEYLFRLEDDLEEVVDIKALLNDENFIDEEDQSSDDDENEKLPDILFLGINSHEGESIEKITGMKLKFNGFNNLPQVIYYRKFMCTKKRRGKKGIKITKEEQNTEHKIKKEEEMKTQQNTEHKIMKEEEEEQNSEDEEMKYVIEKVMEENKDKKDEEGNYIVDFQLFGITFNGVKANGIPFRKATNCHAVDRYKRFPYLSESYKIIIHLFKTKLIERGFPKFDPKSRFNKLNHEENTKYFVMCRKMIDKVYELYFIGHIREFSEINEYFMYYLHQNDDKSEEIVQLFIDSYAECKDKCTKYKRVFDTIYNRKATDYF